METLGIQLRQFALSLSASSTFFPPSFPWILDSEKKNIDKTSIAVRRRKPKKQSGHSWPFGGMLPKQKNTKNIRENRKKTKQ
jgi:hypothetical protein